MRLAILGYDSETLAIAQAVDGREHQIVAACEFEPSRLPVSHTDNWEVLLDDVKIDAVIVGGPDQDLRIEQVRKFVQAGMPVMATFPLFSSMLTYYELDMVRRDVEGVLLPYLPWRMHPVIVELTRIAAAGANGPIGLVEQVTFERHLGNRDQDSVRRAFARDVDLLRSIGGELTRLGAMAGGAPQSFANLNIQLSGPLGILTRWSVAPADDQNWCRISLLGNNGRAVVTMPENTAAWPLELTVGSNRMDRPITEDWNPARQALEQLSVAISGQPVSPDWSDAARAMELAETIDRSLKRGRTIELLQEEMSEEGNFKGLMSAFGCGLLIAVLVLLVIVAVIEDLGRAAGRRVPLISSWPTLLAGILIAFLLLQLLLLIARSGRKPKQSPDLPPDRH